MRALEEPLQLDFSAHYIWHFLFCDRRPLFFGGAPSGLGEYFCAPMGFLLCLLLAAAWRLGQGDAHPATSLLLSGPSPSGVVLLGDLRRNGTRVRRW